MGKVVNLNRYRKGKARAEKRAAADENAARHGRSKAEKAQDSAVVSQFERHVDQHRRDEEPKAEE